MKRWRILVLIALLIAAAFAVLALSAGRIQHSLTYFPTRTIVAPTQAGVSAVRIRTEDGETLVGWWLPPPPGGPVILFFDGNGGRPEAWAGRWAQIADGGAGFLALYYRGYSGSTGVPSEPGLYIDARAGYDWLTEQGFTPRDIVIHGFSLGSAVAVRLASERPARALVLEAPLTGIDDVAVRHYSPMAAWFMPERFASRDYIGRVHMPVLIVHGDADEVVAFELGERLFAMANQPKQFVRIAGAHHTDLADGGLYDHLWPFLAQHPPE
jgi:uncharacterized protein